MNLDMELLRSFVIASETLNFSETGNRLGKTQSSISAHIQKLEDITGQRLFKRSRGKPMELTQQGRSLLSYANKILQMNYDALDALNPGKEKKVLHLGSTETYALSILPKTLSLFSRLHPNIQLNIRCQRSPVLFKALKEGHLDLVLVTDQGEQHNRTLIRNDSLVWVASQQFSFSAEAPLPLAFIPEGCEYRDIGINALEKSGQKYRIVMTSPSPMGVRAALLADMAITVMPQIAVDHTLRILGERDGLPALGKTPIVIYNRSLEKNTAVFELIDLIKNENIN